VNLENGRSIPHCQFGEEAKIVIEKPPSPETGRQISESPPLSLYDTENFWCSTFSPFIAVGIDLPNININLNPLNLHITPSPDNLKKAFDSFSGLPFRLLFFLDHPVILLLPLF